ncbi:hypothetical protein ACFO3J_30385 [Streptomyces polygonati]|uniref:Uncharacterized protein n=1 Tax=Streptomyces polygonati TaxID=1617087 RepID=A0ABV8HUV3_9ACTN
MTERVGPWVGDLVHDPVTHKNATLTDVRSDGTYQLRDPDGFGQWSAQDPGRLSVVIRRADRTDG